MILETERLTLAPLTASDAPLVYPFLSDPEVMAHWDQAPIEDPDEVAACVLAQVAEMDQGKAHQWRCATRDGSLHRVLASWSTSTSAITGPNCGSWLRARDGARATGSKLSAPFWPTPPRSASSA